MAHTTIGVDFVRRRRLWEMTVPSTTYRFKTKPYKHQVKALRKLMSNGYGGALLMEPRTGKTKVTIDFLSMLATRKRIDRAVIVVPNRVIDVWIEEFHVHCPINYNIIVWDAQGRKAMPVIPEPSRAHQLTVLLVNYEAFASPGKKLASGRRSKSTGRFKHRKEIEKWTGRKPAAMVLDESHKVKSPSGRASVMIVGMGRRFRYRLILTGTPITKAHRVFDVYMQWRFLNPERFSMWPTVDMFKNHFGVWTNKNGYEQFLKQRNTDELTELIMKDAYRVARADCFDLPPRTTRIVPVELTAQTGRAYDTLAREYVVMIEKGDREHIVEASIPLVVTLRLTQITGGWTKSDVGEQVELGGEKLAALKQIIQEEVIDNDEKVVVCARFRDEMDAITASCREAGVPVYEIRGGLDRSEVTANIAGFRDQGGAAVCVMNPQAGGVGIDLRAASMMIWYSLTPSWVNYTQACDRIALSDKPTTFVYLQAKGTVDELVYDTLNNDGDVSRAILDDPRKVLRK